MGRKLKPFREPMTDVQVSVETHGRLEQYKRQHPGLTMSQVVRSILKDRELLDEQTIQLRKTIEELEYDLEMWKSISSDQRKKLEEKGELEVPELLKIIKSKRSQALKATL